MVPLVGIQAAAGTYGKTFEGFAVTELLSYPKPDGSVRRDAEHHIRRIVRQSTAVPLQETKRRRRTDFVRQHVGKEAMGDFRAVGQRILGRPVGSNNAGDRLANNLAIRREIIGRAAGIQPIAEILVKLREQRVDHRQANAVDRPPAAGIGGERCHGPHADPSGTERVSEKLGVGHFQHDGIDRVAGEQVLRLPRIPSGQVDYRAILERVADRVQHVRLDPERIACPAGPDAQASCRGDRFAGDALCHDSAGRIRV